MLVPNLPVHPKPSAQELHNLEDELDRILNSEAQAREKPPSDKHASMPKTGDTPPPEPPLSDDVNSLLLGHHGGGGPSTLPPLSSSLLTALPTLTSSTLPPMATSAITSSRDFLDILNHSDHDDYEDDFEEPPSQHPPVSLGHHLASLSQDKLSMLSDAITEEDGEEGDSEGSNDTPLMKDFEDLHLVTDDDDDTLNKLTSYRKHSSEKLESEKTSDAIESLYHNDSSGSEF